MQPFQNFVKDLYTLIEKSLNYAMWQVALLYYSDHFNHFEYLEIYNLIFSIMHGISIPAYCTQIYDHKENKRSLKIDWYNIIACY